MKAGRAQRPVQQLGVGIGTEFVGQVDLKTVRKTKVLWIKNLVWEERKAEQEHLWKSLAKSLKDFAAFNECESIDSEAILPDWGRNIVIWNADAAD